MFSRIHTMKFQNELAKVSMKSTLKSILHNAYKEGLCYTTIIDINKTTLFFSIHGLMKKHLINFIKQI